MKTQERRKVLGRFPQKAPGTLNFIPQFPDLKATPSLPPLASRTGAQGAEVGNVFLQQKVLGKGPHDL